jgi:uncharacterized protein (DUF305 family)
MKNGLNLDPRKAKGFAIGLLVASMMLGSSCAPRARAAVPYDLMFIDAMIVHHQGAIAMARPAGSNAMHRELKDFARKIVDDQSREIALMTQWRDQWFPGQPQTQNILYMPGMTKTMMDTSPMHLEKLTGAAFDKMFIDMMIPHHEGAVTMAKDALAKSQRPEIRELAQRIVDIQGMEIEMMKRWKSEWFKAGP